MRYWFFGIVELMPLIMANLTRPGTVAERGPPTHAERHFNWDKGQVDIRECRSHVDFGEIDKTKQCDNHFNEVKSTSLISEICTVFWTIT